MESKAADNNDNTSNEIQKAMETEIMKSQNNETVLKNYNLSMGEFILRWNILMYLFVFLLFLMGLNYLPYNNQYDGNFCVILLFGFWYLGFEMVVSYFCVYSTRNKIIQYLSVATIIIYFLEGIIVAVWPESVFAIFFSFQFIISDFASIYSSLFLIFCNRMKKHSILCVLFEIIFLIFKLYSLGIPFILVHTNVAKPNSVGFTYRLLFSFTKLMLATNIIIDKFKYIAQCIFYNKQIILNDNQSKIVARTFCLATQMVFVISLALYSSSGHWTANNEMNGYYPLAIWLEFALYVNWPLFFLAMFWMLCTKIYINCQQKKIRFNF